MNVLSRLAFVNFKEIGRYVKKDPALLFILIFMGLLITSAVFLCLDNETFAEKIGEYAFYSLVGGVLLRCASTIIRKGSEKAR